MPAEDTSGPDQPPQFRSPKRTLARAFRLSRDKWKAKAGERRAQIRSMKVRLRDVEASRDLWKQKALHLQQQLDGLTALSSSALAEDPSEASAPPTTHASEVSVPPSPPAVPPAFSPEAAAPALAPPTSSAAPLEKKQQPEKTLNEAE
jgi:hypothetical protein